MTKNRTVKEGCKFYPAIVTRDALKYVCMTHRKKERFIHTDHPCVYAFSQANYGTKSIQLYMVEGYNTPIITHRLNLVACFASTQIK